MWISPGKLAWKIGLEQQNIRDLTFENRFFNHKIRD
jgi:hypothetical protein